MMASDGGTLFCAPGVTTGGTGSHTSVSLGPGFAGVCAAGAWPACGAAACWALAGKASAAVNVRMSVIEDIVRMIKPVEKVRESRLLGFRTAAERTVK